MVILPCLGALFTLAFVMVPAAGTTGMQARTWLSIISGPLACWIEMSWHFKPDEKAYHTLLALALALGMLSHPLRPHTMTVAIAVLASCLWLFFGIALTYAGWG